LYLQVEVKPGGRPTELVLVLDAVPNFMVREGQGMRTCCFKFGVERMEHYRAGTFLSAFYAGHTINADEFFLLHRLNKFQRFVKESIPDFLHLQWKNEKCLRWNSGAS
jgi:hypothetical protein